MNPRTIIPAKQHWRNTQPGGTARESWPKLNANVLREF